MITIIKVKKTLKNVKKIIYCHIVTFSSTFIIVVIMAIFYYLLFVAKIKRLLAIFCG